MFCSKRMLADVQAELSLPHSAISAVARRFRQAMADGRAGRNSALKMLPSFLAKPDGNEQGEFVTVDFGGSNIRVQRVELLGSGHWRLHKLTWLPLKEPAGLYDYTAASTSSEALFDFLAGLVAEVAGAGCQGLGFTFSYPCSQLAVDKAVLINWTKELKTAGVEGAEVGMLLKASLARRGLGRLPLLAILNDTVGTLLSAAYSRPGTDIAAICGTGHNTCYWDERAGMVINMESGNFDGIPVTRYDAELDAASDKPGGQLLEKMVAGRYLGELATAIARDSVPGFAGNRITTEMIGMLLGEAGLATGLSMTEQQAEMVRTICRAVADRSARLVAATFLGTLAYMDPGLEKHHVIAIDGSLYAKMPGYAAAITGTLQEALGVKAALVETALMQDGSGIGAAVAAAVARKNLR